MLIIALVLLVSYMGVRIGIFIALMVPVITVSSLALYAWGGGVLQQISIAAFVLALGFWLITLIVIVEGFKTSWIAGWP